jgi:hypothetical protein
MGVEPTNAEDVTPRPAARLRISAAKG